MSIVKETEKKMTNAIAHLKEELKHIRTGRANPGLVENVKIDLYGSQMHVRDVANITTPEMRQLLITPYDPQTTAAIGKGIEAANIGIRPVVDANCIRLNVPPMDQAVRNSMVKLCHQRREEGKVAVRNLRREANDLVKKQKASGEIPEDQMKRMEKEIQDLTDKYCKLADTAAADKEKEINTI